MATSSQSFKDQMEKDLLTCPICCDRYNNPRVLKCQHTFCFRCLQGCLKASQSATEIKCAVCRKTTSLSSKGLTAFPANLTIANLLQIVNDTKKQTSGGKGNGGQPKTSVTPSITPKVNTVKATSKQATVMNKVRNKYRSQQISRRRVDDTEDSEDSEYDSSSDYTSSEESCGGNCRDCNCGRYRSKAPQRESRKNGGCCQERSGGRSQGKMNRRNGGCCQETGSRRNGGSGCQERGSRRNGGSCRQETGSRTKQAGCCQERGSGRQGARSKYYSQRSRRGYTSSEDSSDSDSFDDSSDY